MGVLQERAPVRLRRAVQGVRLSSQGLIALAVLVAVGALVVIPFATMVLSSLRPPAALPFATDEVTLENLTRVFTDPVTYTLLRNTFLYVLLSMAVAMLIAVPFAWLIERTDMPFRNAVYTLLLLPVAIPSFITALAWVLLLGPNAGIINVGLREVFDIEGRRGPLNVYSLPGMVLITAVAIVPTMFLLLSGLFRNFNPQLEEASSTSGANTLRTARRITLPLMAPGLLAVVTYYLVAGLDFLEIPIVLGPNAGFRVLSVEIFARTHPTPGIPLYGLAATYGLLAVAISIPVIYLYGRATRSSEKYAVVTGKLASQYPVRLGRMRFLALGAIAAYLFVAVVLPVTVIVWTSFLPFFQGVSARALSLLTLSNYEGLLANPRVLSAFVNTGLMFVATATLTMLLAALVAWIVVRFKVPGVRWLERIAVIPLAIPGIILALAVLLFYIQTPLWGTIWIIVLGQTVRYLPIGVRFMHAAQMQIHREIEEAGQTSGASDLRVFRTITLPLIRPSFLNGWLYVATSSLRDFTFPLLLISISNVVVTSLLWELWQIPDISGASALASVIIAFSMVMTLVTRRLITRR